VTEYSSRPAMQWLWDIGQLNHRQSLRPHIRCWISGLSRGKLDWANRGVEAGHDGQYGCRSVRIKDRRILETAMSRFLDSRVSLGTKRWNLKTICRRVNRSVIELVGQLLLSGILCYRGDRKTAYSLVRVVKTHIQEISNHPTSETDCWKLSRRSGKRGVLLPSR